MQRTRGWLVATVLLLGGLVACQPAALKATLPPPTSTATATATAVPTATPVPPTATPVPTPTEAATSEPPPPAAETPTREPVAQAQPTPTRPWQIPNVLDGEHGKGNPDAGLVLVEYSDFQ